MRLCFFLKIHANKVMMVLVLLALLSGCGTQNQPSNSSNPSPVSTTSNSPTSNSVNILSINKTGVSIDEAGLHIDASNGFQCPSGAMVTGTADNPGSLVFEEAGNNLVLATSRLTYDSNELQQIQDYVQATTRGDLNSVQIPDTLQWVLGGPIDTGRALNVSGTTSVFAYDCSLQLQITNTSQNLIQIASASVQLAANTQQNNYSYRLIDVCSFSKDQCMFGGGPSPCIYSATIKLGTGLTNAVFSAPVGSSGDSSCGELTLQPKDAKDLTIYIYSPQNLIYSAVPQLVVDTSSGPNTLTLSELTSKLAFANGNQFTCYGLQGDTFVAEMPLPATSECI